MSKTIEQIKNKFTTEDYTKIQSKSFTIPLYILKIIDEVSKETGINKSKLVSLLLEKVLEENTIKDIKNLICKK